MDKYELLQEIKQRLAAVHGDRLCGVVLYGSEARGTAGPDSDIDVLVLLKGPISSSSDLQVDIHALYPLTLELGRPISPYPVDIERYEATEWPLYVEANAEGVRIGSSMPWTLSKRPGRS